MNADKMTREEFDRWMSSLSGASEDTEVAMLEESLWDRIDAIQSAPFVPDWSSCPGAIAFEGDWIFDDRSPVQAFYIHAPSNPSDAELSAMFNKFDKDKRVQILRDAGVVV